jgi:hypothetical protein
MKGIGLFSIVLATVFTGHLYAKTFTSQYTEFELPIGWDCALEGSEWVCQSSDKDRKKEAIIILAAKYRGEQDSLDQYQAYLKQPKSFTLPGGKQQISEAKSVSIKPINGQQWVDALHLASEVPGFYTRYLATVKDTLGIAVTFSVSKDHYNDYQDIFEKIVATLKVFEQKGNNNLALKNSKTDENLMEDAGSTIGSTDPNANIGMNKQKKASGFGDDTTSLILIVGAALVIFIIIRMKKKK